MADIESASSTMSDVPTRVDESDRAASPTDLTETSDSDAETLPPFPGPPTSNTDSASPEHDDEFIHFTDLLEGPLVKEMNEDLLRSYKVYLGTGKLDRARAFRNGRYTVDEKVKRNAIDVKCMPGTLAPDDLD